VFELVRRTTLDRQLHAALALMGVPDAVVETELHFLLDVAGEIVRRHPARVDIERGLTAVGIGVDHLQLHGIPGGTGGRADEATLPGSADACEAPRRLPKREIDQFDV